MMHLIQQILLTAWDVLAEMSPYLILGFLVAGLMSIWLPASLVEKHLGQRGWLQVVKATLFGIPIPLCSCGVIPVAASLRRHGAGKGATVSFLSSTPQTGVDSIAVTYALMGGIFAVFRVAAAFVSGLVTGMAVDALDGDEGAPAAEEKPSCCCSGSQKEAPPPAWIRALRHGFITLPGDIGRALLVGLLISGLIGALVPQNFFADHLGSGLPAMLVVMAIGIPFYVCSTASVPIALGLLMAGATPGAALVFLISGPATNAATFTTIWKLIGARSTLVYLTAIAASALGAGILMDLAFPELMVAIAEHGHEMVLPAWKHGAAVALLGILAYSTFVGRKKKS